jgi:hypothetical protein
MPSDGYSIDSCNPALSGLACTAVSDSFAEEVPAIMKMAIRIETRSEPRPFVIFDPDIAILPRTPSAGIEAIFGSPRPTRFIVASEEASDMPFC